MLYDPKWEVEVKTDPFSRESLVAWLEKQDPNESYDWHCQGRCMLGQWLRSIEPFSAGNPDGDSWSYIVNGAVMDFSKFTDIALYGDATFGAALARARGQ